MNNPIEISIAYKESNNPNKLVPFLTDLFFTLSEEQVEVDDVHLILNNIILELRVEKEVFLDTLTRISSKASYGEEGEAYSLALSRRGAILSNLAYHYVLSIPDSMYSYLISGCFSPTPTPQPQPEAFNVVILPNNSTYEYLFEPTLTVQ